jgi:hypothetical protein
VGPQGGKKLTAKGTWGLGKENGQQALQPGLWMEDDRNQLCLGGLALSSTKGQRKISE